MATYISNLKYPKGQARTEDSINAYYNRRETELQAQYESRLRELDTQLYENDEKMRAIQVYYDANQDLIDERNELLEEYERGTVDTTNIVQQIAILDNRYNRLEDAWYVTEEKEKRDAIKDEAIKTYAEKQALEERIKLMEEQDAEVRKRYFDDAGKIDKKIQANNKKITKLSEIEEKQQEIIAKERRYADELQADLEKNEVQREKELENLAVKVLNVKVKKYASGPVSKNRKRLVVVPFVVSIDYPEGENPAEIPEDKLVELGIEACDLVAGDYVTPNPSEMSITDAPPSGSGWDIYDYERSSYASDFTNISVFYDYGIDLGYTRLPDGKNYALPED